MFAWLKAAGFVPDALPGLPLETAVGLQPVWSRHAPVRDEVHAFVGAG